MITLSRQKSKQKGKAGFNLGRALWPVAKTLAGIVPFVEQISAKHRQTLGNNWTQAPLGQKFKIMTNIITGSMLGIPVFKDEYSPPQTFKLENAWNKWTQNGLALMAYSIVGKSVNKAVGRKVAPLTSKVGIIASEIITSGAIGGIFDDPVEQKQSSQGTARFSPKLEPAISYSRNYNNSYEEYAVASGGSLN